MSIRKKKVFVSGCFNILHGGYVVFLKEAAQFGDLYIGPGSDKSLPELKVREPINPKDEGVQILSVLARSKSMR
jgi:cytidyltransferase-like protein